MTDVFIDLGHSRAKWAFGQGGRLNEGGSGACPAVDLAPLRAALTEARPARAWYSPQGDPDRVAALEHELSALGLSCRPVTTGSIALPVAPAYPQLGTDRWLALQWPWQQSRAPFCLIDCGTAVTIDAVDARGRHLGGWIMAGLPALRHGLGGLARRLPDAAMEPEAAEAPATDSQRAIGGGLSLQMAGGIERAVEGLRARLGQDIELWLTGGDAEWIRPLLHEATRSDPHLVLRGLALAGSES
ncbi:type III pantothenate kinase [Wenzhouxiangella marina]|uniref:Type III pantothenate kinase n=1 Tax=Wenzhouxiangella marina TaxID=1579979 RepID=A0A0K0XZS7_9GAMM|nr:type III pantothenate kinase [Wenzhouxiangella marina]AKS43175.1 hypothetical protein WM2015_2818 [Wenzhouxiangella marina]MBB6087140.1 type III pantothenate kinase [Wenzhouxiangella marina]